MNLSALIRGEKIRPKRSAAKANLANVARMDVSSVAEPVSLAKLATLAANDLIIESTDVMSFNDNQKTEKLISAGRNTLSISARVRCACHWCKSQDLWESAKQDNHWICRQCHPPAPGAERLVRKVSLTT